MAKHFVTAPLVLLKVAGEIRYLYVNTPVPSDADPDHLQHLLDLGMVGTEDELAEAVDLTANSVVDPEETDPTADAAVDYSAMDYAGLQEAAKTKGIPANQSKDELIKALSA